MIKLLFLFFSIQLICEKGICQEMHIDRITVKYVNRNILTIFDINCNEFEKDLKGSIKEKNIEDSLILTNFKQLLKTIKYEKRNGSIDVRNKLYIYYSNKLNPEIICTDGYRKIMLNGRKIRNNKKLIEIVNSWTL
ncbi:hypothetical protein [Niastella populi]|uniref:Uncharacterized protein n=1 Tax=Niastella populi TaxID=550983 RepID=A0A1V9FBY2_9BACT|nr:hypothetical protein [Niastella populi]OQP55781.1 hypothetical protein A4R26_27155 [Niastella populi]